MRSFPLRSPYAATAADGVAAADEVADLAPARRPTVHRLGPAPGTTVEGRLLAEVGGDHLVDLRHDDVPDWLRAPSSVREHGATAPTSPVLAATSLTPADEFDGLAVVTHSHSSTPLRPSSTSGGMT